MPANPEKNAVCKDLQGVLQKRGMCVFLHLILHYGKIRIGCSSWARVRWHHGKIPKEWQFAFFTLVVTRIVAGWSIGGRRGMHRYYNDTTKFLRIAWPRMVESVQGRWRSTASNVDFNSTVFFIHYRYNFHKTIISKHGSEPV